jgi:hypothetical protein
MINGRIPVAILVDVPAGQLGVGTLPGASCSDCNGRRARIGRPRADITPRAWGRSNHAGTRKFFRHFAIQSRIQRSVSCAQLLTKVGIWVGGRGQGAASGLSLSHFLFFLTKRMRIPFFLLEANTPARQVVVTKRSPT